MLKISHHYKLEIEHQIQWRSQHKVRMEKELDQFRIEQGIQCWKDEMDWIKENGALQYHICIQDLLLQTLYTLSGSYYRINDRDYEWAEEFANICFLIFILLVILYLFRGPLFSSSQIDLIVMK